MDTYAIYSYCVPVPGLAHIDDTTLLRKQQQFLYQHDDLGSFSLSFCYSSKNQLKVFLSGPTASLLQARGDLFSGDVIEIRSAIQSIHPHVLYDQTKRLQLTERLDTIAKECQVTATIDAVVEPSIILQGSLRNVEAARVQILIYLDQMLELRVESVELPPLLHNLLGGKRHYQLQSVMEETATNIYLESPFIIGHAGTPLQEQEGTVHISGDTVGMKRAKSLVKKLAEQKLNCLCHKESTLDPRKIDWIILHQQDKLKKILRDNGSFIHFPRVGAGSSIIQVYAENRINIERTLRLVNHMAYNIYHATIKIRHRFLQREEVANFVTQLAEFSGGEVLYREEQHRLDIYGSDTAIRLVYQHFKDSKLLEYHLSTVISIELAAEHRAFTKGKKSGKVNKIVKSSGASIKFLSAYSEYNCLVTVDSNDIDKVFYGLELLSHELPEERSFYVPEIYHRRIIGVGGKNIQRIMKKYGVYVKFSGADEFTELGGYFENEHNVFARTPRKYSNSLKQLYDEIMELITFEKDRNWVSCNVKVPLYLHRTIPNRYSDCLREYGRLHNTRLWWPPRCGTADVVVVGPITQVRRIQAAVLNLLPHHDYVAFPTSPSLAKFLESKAILGQLKQLIKSDWSVTLVEPDPRVKEIQPTSHVRWQTPHSFKNALVFQLTVIINSAQRPNADGNSTIIDDYYARLFAAKQYLIDQLLTYNVSQVSLAKKPNAATTMAAVAKIISTTTKATPVLSNVASITNPTPMAIFPSSIMKPKYPSPTSVLTHIANMDTFNNWVPPKRYSALNTDIRNQTSTASFYTNNNMVGIDSHLSSLNIDVSHSSPYKIPKTPTSTTDNNIIPPFAKSIWSNDQSKDDSWHTPVMNASKFYESMHEQLDRIKIDEDRSRLQNSQQLHQQSNQMRTSRSHTPSLSAVLHNHASTQDYPSLMAIPPSTIYGNDVKETQITTSTNIYVSHIANTVSNGMIAPSSSSQSLPPSLLQHRDKSVHSEANYGLPSFGNVPRADKHDTLIEASLSSPYPL